MDLLEPPSLRSQAFLSLDAAISLPLARFMIENRRRTSAETQKRLYSSDLEMGVARYIVVVASIFSRALYRSPLLEFLDPPLPCIGLCKNHMHDYISSATYVHDVYMAKKNHTQLLIESLILDFFSQ